MDRKTQTKQKILDAALTVFAKDGYDLASTNAIYQLAGVSKGVIFKYFTSKSDLFLAVFERELQALLLGFDSLDFSTSTDPMERIEALILWKIDFANRHREATALLSEGVSNPPKELAIRIRSQLGELNKMSIERFFGEIDMDKIKPEFSKADVLRNLQIAASGLQAVYVTGHPNFSFSEASRAECLRYMRFVYRGMEKES